MTKFVIDAYAWIEYLDGSEKGRKVAEMLEDQDNEFFTSSATAGEIVSKTLKVNKDIAVALNFVNNFSTVVPISQEIGILAGQIHFETKKKSKEFGMIDAFVAAAAKKINAKILTGDGDFRSFKNAVFI